MRQKGLRLGLTFTLVSALIAGCAGTGTNSAPASGSGSAEGAKVVKVGVVAPLTGNLAAAGKFMVQGAELAVKQINEQGLAGKYQLKIVTLDDEGVPKNTVSAVNKLVEQEKVVAVVGTFASSGVLASMEVTREAKVPQFAPVASNPKITEQKNPYIFRMNASDLAQARGVTEYAVKQAGVKKLAILHQTDDYGTGGVPVIKEAAEKNGAQIVATVAFNPGEKDLSSQVLKAKEAGADGIVVWSYYTEGALIAKAAKELAYKPKLFGGGATMYPQLIELGGDAVEGWVSVTPYATDTKTDKQKQFLDSYRLAYKADPDPSVAMTYDILQMIAAAVKDGNDSPQKLRDWVAGVKNFEGVTATFSALPNGDMERGFVYVEVKGGKWVAH